MWDIVIFWVYYRKEENFSKICKLNKNHMSIYFCRVML